MMQKLRLLVVGFLAFTAGGCGAYETEKLILGTWEWSEVARSGETSLTLEFAKSGALRAFGSIHAETFATVGRFRFLNEKTFEVTRTSEGVLSTEITRIESIDQDKLVTCNPQGQKVEFRRVN